MNENSGRIFNFVIKIFSNFLEFSDIAWSVVNTANFKFDPFSGVDFRVSVLLWLVGSLSDDRSILHFAGQSDAICFLDGYVWNLRLWSSSRDLLILSHILLWRLFSLLLRLLLWRLLITLSRLFGRSSSKEQFVNILLVLRFLLIGVKFGSSLVVLELDSFVVLHSESHSNGHF